MKPQVQRRVWSALVAVVVAGAVVWVIRGDEISGSDVLTAEVSRGDIEDTVTALGNLQPRDYVDVGAQVSGQLKKIHAKIGDTVQQGDLLAEIDAVVLSAKVASTRASLTASRANLVDRQAQVALAEDKYQRQVQLKAEDATSEEAFQDAKASLDSARAQVAVLEAQIKQTEASLEGDAATLGYSKIYAPMAGTVVSMTGREGQTLNTNQTAPIILRIADLSTMTVWTQVSEADVPKLREGMSAYFSTLGRPDRRWNGTLTQVLPTPELVNNVVLYTALFDVANPDTELKTQMSAQVFFVTAQARDVITVPASALHAWRPPAEGGEPPGAPGAVSAESAMAAAEGAPPGGRRRPPQGVEGGEGFAGGPPMGQGGPPMGQGGPRGEGRRASLGAPGGASPMGEAANRPRVQAVTVVDAEGNQSERRVVIGVTNRVTAEVLEGLEPGEVVVSGRRVDSATLQQQNQQAQRGPGGAGGPPGGFRFP